MCVDGVEDLGSKIRQRLWELLGLEGVGGVDDRPLHTSSKGRQRKRDKDVEGVLCYRKKGCSRRLVVLAVSFSLRLWVFCSARFWKTDESDIKKAKRTEGDRYTVMLMALR